MTAYYNEIDPYAAQWLRNLIEAGHIPPGIVDTRSIEDVTPADLTRYTQCHFFAGLGGWALALDLAGWPRDKPVWTGSCPCQPFSAAGKGNGFEDERHLWPAWQHLVAECRPAVVLGEQVASKAADAWIDLVHADLESMGYAFGCIPFPAAGVGAPHIRERNYWVAHANVPRSSLGLPTETWGYKGLTGVPDHGGGEHARAPGRPETSRVADIARSGWREERANDGGLPIGNSTQRITAGFIDGRSDSGVGPTNGLWRDADWLACRDGKWRPVEPGTFPLAHGVSGRVGRLRAYGNAIVAEQAAEFIRAYLEALGSEGVAA